MQSATSRLIPAPVGGVDFRAGLAGQPHRLWRVSSFSGALQPWSSQGIGLILFGAFAGCLIVAPDRWFSRRDRGTLTGSRNRDGRHRFHHRRRRADSFRDNLRGAGNRCYLCRRALLSDRRLAPGQPWFASFRIPLPAGSLPESAAPCFLGAIESAGVTPGWRSMAEVFEASSLLLWGPGAFYGLAFVFRHAPMAQPLDPASQRSYRGRRLPRRFSRRRGLSSEEARNRGPASGRHGGRNLVAGPLARLILRTSTGPAMPGQIAQPAGIGHRRIDLRDHESRGTGRWQ